MPAPITGTVTPPDDLQPAIDALTDRGRAHLYKLWHSTPGDIKPWMIARAADHERGEGPSLT